MAKLKIVVTGATGLLGRATASHLVERGHEVISVDRKTGDFAVGSKLVVGELTSLDFCDSVIEGANAVVHLGAIPNPTDARQFNVFQNNSVSTFGVFTAAAQAKVKTVVYASSLSAYGFAYSDEWTSPIYAPVDEAHPFIFEESYALSKEVNERSALMWSRRCDTAFVGMRFPWTNTPEKTLELARRFNDEDNLPPDPRFPKGIVAKILWTYLDLRDAVKAIEVVINSDIKGSHVYNFAAPDIMAKAPTMELMAKFHPKTEIRSPLPGHTAPLLSQAFVDTFGYAPQYLINRGEI
ncbi:MAG: NAD(P)-dependent oxidoreductase [Actinomycetales bacterium]|nr:MAG: NAD(P)-dependent oxidoreductase [Actinomycetales bacterium]